ncbi:LPS-assembly protein LptD [Altericroceibacterium xinjiangense]|uniref:LPS-assembly protein LptD n=1 Tax=Altericroceibacterium xinjiangense TaxID=762261 RepID=UPI000F7F40BE|nr:LPS assembly protein LptD [Altericroceibacterium xinjiangense]
MLPTRQSPLQASNPCLRRIRLGAALAALAIGCWPVASYAQQGAPPGVEPADPPVRLPAPRDPVFTGDEQPGFPNAIVAPPGTEAITDADGTRDIAFEANQLDFDSDSDVVTASGDVVLRSGDQSVRADAVTWDRQTGQIVATGTVRFVDEDGNQLFTDRLELTDELRAGTMSNLLLAMRAGGRLAAEEGRRNDAGQVVLETAVYSACAVETAAGCPKDPSWRITADRVIYDPVAERVRFRGAFLEVFGQRILPLPGFAAALGGQANSGLLIPSIGLTASNGLEINGSYYWRLDPDRDLTVSGFVYTEAQPMVSAQYRELTELGAYQITGYLTRGSRIPVNSELSLPEEGWRGYLFANGKFILDPNWTVTASARLASDRTFLRRYDISRDDRIRSTFNIERIDEDSYLSVAGWATQVLLTDDEQGMVPIALPVIDYRRRIEDPLLGGRAELQLNTLALTRVDGMDTQRAFARMQWDRRRITRWGQELTFTALLRGDVYHSDENATLATPQYRGLPGWQARGIAIGAVDVEWPLVGSLLGGTQVLTPRIQLVASPPIRNLAIPNEDSRAIELEDSNLFALNRFPGYDRVEGGTRATYGVDWLFQRPGWQVKSTVGQSYRLTDKPSLFFDGTGLSEQFSDWVGRTQVRYRDFVRFTHRFRLDKDTFAVRRNEVDAAVGTDRTYVEVGYLRLNRDIDTSFEDLQDREELRAAGRVAFAQYWSVFGSAVINLTDREEDPTFTSSGFEPLRTRLGIGYADDCLEFGATWRRDYISVADAQQGNSFQLYFALRNLGFR